MRTLSRMLVAHPVYRVPNSVVVLGIPILAGALATWGGVRLPVVLPVAVAGLVVVSFLAARPALRQASARIDAILREELGSPLEQSVQTERGERVVDDHRRRPDYSSLVARAGLDDAELRRRQRQ